ncbi:MAG: hypothetical protein QG594_541 [Bacteroidota bacterium]|nr:hypothetical protein [Bacteroidota bacterium]
MKPFNPALLSSKNIKVGNIESVRFLEEKWCITISLPLNDDIQAKKPSEYLKPKTGAFERALRSIVPVLVDFHVIGYDPEGNLFNLDRLQDMKQGLSAEREELLTIAKITRVEFKFDLKQNNKKDFLGCLKEVFIEGRGRENKNTGKFQLLEAKVGFLKAGNQNFQEVMLEFYNSVLEFLVAPEESGFLK